MTPLLINTYDTLGGAAIASCRLLNGLNRNGIQARMLVQEKMGENPNVITLPRGRFRNALVGLRTVIDQQPLRSVYPERRLVPYSLNWLPGRYGHTLRTLAPEVVNLHWINAGFLSLGTIGRIPGPVVWTLHDMWPFTGICHYSDGCLKFRDACGACPLLGSDRLLDLSRWNLRRKRKNLSKLELTIAAPSRWIADQARRSRLFGHLPITVIPNGIDLDVFRPMPRTIARDLLHITGDKKILLFGGAHALKDRRKGAYFLSRALEVLKEKTPQAPWQVVVFGTEVPESTLPFHYETRYLGYIQDERLMAQVYAAADIYVTPPTQENLANTVMEALACGTPVVTFDVGGMNEMVSHKNNGYLARSQDVKDLALGIQWTLDSDKRLKRLSKEARDSAVRKFDIIDSARNYHLLYEQMVLERKMKQP